MVYAASRSRLLLLIAATTLFASAHAQRTSYPLDKGWRFHLGEAAPAAAVDFDDSAWDAIVIPHMFPYVDIKGKKDVYRGEAWYRNRFDAPAEWKGQRVFVKFGAASLVADVYLNGKKLGEHRGGYAAFSYEITDAVLYGAPNQLSVRVDDRINQEVLPLEDFLVLGGIYRPVSLLVTGPVDITPVDYASSGVFLRQDKVTAEQASVTVKTEVNNGLSTAKTVTVRLLLIDAQGKPLFKTSATGEVAANKTTPVFETVAIPKPHLWNGVADPYLYTMRVDLLDGDKVIDTVAQPLGLRSYQIDPKRGFILNGTPLQIHGVCLHQDWGDKGWAIGPAEEKQDLRILRDMGADGIRLVHYQHSPSALDLYDKAGMLIWSELPFFRDANGTGAFRQNAREQLTEMIRQNYNHPSIMMWSMFNELGSKTKMAAIPLVQELVKLSHTEDPTRPTAGAAHGDMEYNMADAITAVDQNGFNAYPGWYGGKPEDMNGEIDKLNALFGNRGLAISEYGAGAKVSDHKQNLKPGDVPPYGGFQPEEWQATVHEGDYAAIETHPAAWGSFIWLAFDSGGIPQGTWTADGNIKGLVTQDRKVKKDAYFFYQANWAAQPMLYLTSRRDTRRTDAATPVKVYSNAAAVTLTINGKVVGEEKPDAFHTFRWKKVTLDPGDNHVVITTPDGLHDEATWTLAGAAAK